MRFNTKKAKRNHKVIVAGTVQAIMSIRQWKFSSRFKFVCWLLWGRGDWKGVK
jgi:hypothetical protein